MKAHNLKLDAKYFRSVKDGRKSFEIRKNDRDYKEGDLLLLRRYKHGQYGINSYSMINSFSESTEEEADTITAVITYVTNYAQQDGYVVLGIKLVDIVDKDVNDESTAGD